MPGIWNAWRSGVERRHESRLPVPELAVDSPAVEVDLVDASVTGLGIEVERPLRVGVVYPFRLSRDGKSSVVYGLVRWCESAGPDSFRAGISVGKTVGPPISSLAS